MKIKDIISPIESLKERIYTAYRIYRSEPLIKKRIAQLHEEETLPQVTIEIETPDEARCLRLDSIELKELYGMTDLQVLFFLDSVLKADKKEDKTDLYNLLRILTAGQHRTRFEITDEMREHVRTNNPVVWAEYQKIRGEREQRNKAMEEEYSRIIESEL